MGVLAVLLVELLLLPLWLAVRALVLAFKTSLWTGRFLLQRSTPRRLVGYSIAIGTGIVIPGALLGALLTRFVVGWAQDRPRPVPDWAWVPAVAGSIAAGAVSVAIWVHAQSGLYLVVTAWGLQLLAATFLTVVLALMHAHDPGFFIAVLFTPARLLATLGDGLLAGPAAYAVIGWFLQLPVIERRLKAQRRWEQRWARALRPGHQTWRMRRSLKRSRGHPFGLVRWGWDQINDQALDLEPADLSRHILMLGVTGSGKTTAIGRLAEGALHLGWSVFIIDCKGGSLRETAFRLAKASHASCRILDPLLPGLTLAYNPCQGPPAAVKNKLIGALSF